MEQDRAPAVFLHLVELARPAVAGLRNGRPSHRPDHHGEGIESHLQTGPPQIPNGTRSEQGRDGARQPGTQHISWRMELRHQTKRQSKLIPLFIYSSLAQTTLRSVLGEAKQAEAERE